MNDLRAPSYRDVTMCAATLSPAHRTAVHVLFLCFGLVELVACARCQEDTTARGSRTRWTTCASVQSLSRRSRASEGFLDESTITSARVTACKPAYRAV